ncbi:MAG: hypothetical protein LBK61_05130 [Spirochaetaceae bacterium]|nr:hypothetical protein [Spirochaetaceae bacterium]
MSGNEGSSDDNDGLSEATPFKTLLAAYEAARDSADRKQIVVLSNLTQTGEDADEDALTGPSELITIKGKDGTQTITRSVVANEGAGSVLVITGGAKITFVDIKVNGIVGDGSSIFNRAIKIDGSEVTLGKGAVITGKLQGDSTGDNPGPDGFNTDTKNGSGVFVTNSGKLTIADGSEVTGCEGPVNNDVGTLGAVYANSGSNVLLTKGGKIYKNQALRGGGVAVYGTATFTMTGGEIYKNTGTDSGGGIYASRKGSYDSPTLTLVGGEIYENYTTTGNGGGIYTYKTLVAFTIEDGVVIRNNHAAGAGGGIAAKATTTTNDDDDKTIMMNGGEIRDNEAGTHGGGVYIEAAQAGDVSLTMKGGEISKNTANGNGGGVYLQQVSSKTATFTLTDGVIYGSGDKANSAAQGAAIYKSSANGYTKVIINGTAFSDTKQSEDITVTKAYTP